MSAFIVRPTLNWLRGLLGAPGGLAVAQGYRLTGTDLHGRTVRSLHGQLGPVDTR